jgi:allantoinase
LDGRKGEIAAGSDADIVIWNPEKQFRVTPEMLHHRNKVTPYAGEILSGVVMKTFLRGRTVYDSGKFAEVPQGLFLSRTSATVGSFLG